jgi:hypothetical protein
MSEQGDSKTEQLKSELKRLHVETAERVVCRRLDPLNYRYCAECGRHCGHRPGTMQCVVCDARDIANAETIALWSRGTDRTEGESSNPSALDDLRRRMIAAGIPSEHAASACGFAAEYAMTAYKQGHSRGYNQGFEWGQGEPSSRGNKT